MDITFNCDACEQSIAIDEAGAGSVVECPKCRARVLVPNKSTPTTNLRRCPDCMREVSKRAAACPHCGAPLTGQPPARSTEPASGRASNPAPEILAMLVIIAAMVGGFFAYRFWKDRPLATTLEGEVFIVTKGGQNYKLGLVTVGIEKTDVLKTHLDEEKRDPTVVEERKAYEAAVVIANAAYDNEALRKASEALDTYEDLLVNTVLYSVQIGQIPA